LRKPAPPFQAGGMPVAAFPGISFFDVFLAGHARGGLPASIQLDTNLEPVLPMHGSRPVAATNA